MSERTSEQARRRAMLELAALKREMELEIREQLHQERIRHYGPEKAEQMRRQDVIRELQSRW